MRKYIYVTLISLLLTACGSSPPKQKILGSTAYFIGETKVLADAQVGELRVKHVRRADGECDGKYQEIIEISGEIGADSTAVVARLLPKLKKCHKGNVRIVNKIYLNSDGGLLQDGYKMGNLFRENSTQTVITHGQTCASACAVAFLGGDYRRIDGNGKLIFHAPYLQKSNGIDCSDTGQVAGLRAYYQKMIGQENGSYLLKRTMDFCSETGGWVLNSDGAEMMGITK